jgi:hypothetical protein
MKSLGDKVNAWWNYYMVKFISLRNTKGFITTLSAGLLSGCIGVLVDIDHPLALICGITYGRFLHPLFLVTSGFVIFCLFTYIAGLLLSTILRRKV